MTEYRRAERVPRQAGDGTGSTFSGSVASTQTAHNRVPPNSRMGGDIWRWGRREHRADRAASVNSPKGAGMKLEVVTLNVCGLQSVGGI